MLCFTPLILLMIDNRLRFNNHEEHAVKRGLIRILLLVISTASAFVALPSTAEEVNDQKIRLLGAVKEGVSKRITVADIEALGMQEMQSYNPYELAENLYSGVWLHEIVAAFGSPDVISVRTIAIDDYQVVFTKKEWEEIRILVSTRMDGEIIRFDTKGPMRIVFPDFDPSMSVYQETRPKWMWMITKIEFSE